MKRNHLTNILLMTLVLGIWTAIILLTTNWTRSVEAQGNKPQYGLAALNKENKIVFDGTGTTVLSAAALQSVLWEAPKAGWKIHTVSVYNSSTFNGFVVVLEK